MNKQDTTLLQHWFADVITKPGTLQYKLQQAAHAYKIDEADIVAEEGKAGPLARLNVYTTGYILRLLDCLAADFPVLHKFVGDDVFYGFAKASLVWSPPVSYTLYDLGKNFISFLEATRPPHDKDNPMLNLPIEIAKLERARQEALRAEGTEGAGDVIPDLSVETMLLQPYHLNLSSPPCLRLLQLKFPLKHFYDAVLSGETYNLPQLQNTFVAVSRKNYRITITELEAWQYDFLASCSQPVNIMQAIELTGAKHNIPDSTLIADLYIWLPLFHDNGLLVIRD